MRYAAPRSPRTPTPLLAALACALAAPAANAANAVPGGPPPLVVEIPETSGGGPLGAREGQGSGFFVSPSGLIVTNGHVVAGCTEVEIAGHGVGKVLAVDQSVDLATVQPERADSVVPAEIAAGPLRLGQSVAVLGYPLADLLGHSVSVTTGVVSTEVGLGGDRRQFTMTASLEPGSSGGPVFDAKGRVVGVAASKMNAVAMILTTGSAGSNINFAVNADALRTFLTRHAWSAPDATTTAADLPMEDAVAMVRRSTVELTCRPPAVGEQ
ncbi:MAG: serine protease [Bauldia sp.]